MPVFTRKIITVFVMQSVRDNMSAFLDSSSPGAICGCVSALPLRSQNDKKRTNYKLAMSGGLNLFTAGKGRTGEIYVFMELTPHTREKGFLFYEE